MKLPVSAQTCLLATGCAFSRTQLRCLMMRRINKLEKVYIGKLKTVQGLPVEKQSRAYYKVIRVYKQRLKETVLSANRPQVALSAKICVDKITNQYVTDIMSKVQRVMEYDSISNSTLMQRHLDYVVSDGTLQPDMAMEELKNALEPSN